MCRSSACRSLSNVGMGSPLLPPAQRVSQQSMPGDL